MVEAPILQHATIGWIDDHRHLGEKPTHLGSQASYRATRGRSPQMPA